MTDSVTHPHLQVAIAGPVATITFARPQKSNAYDKAMLRALDEGIRKAEEDSSVRMLVLRGEGKHFSAGADLGGEESAGKPGPGVAEVCLRLSGLPKPTIAAVQGACVGGGMAFVICCDIVIAAQDAFFSMPEVRIGFSPTPLIPFVLRAVGERHARRILMSGARLSADEALRIGLASEVCVREEMDKAVEDAISALLQSAPGAVAEVKAQVARLRNVNPTAELLTVLQCGFDAARDSAEPQEGRAAIREKRRPAWAIKP
jgi:methylglutaconyl-CoA hydratase